MLFCFRLLKEVNIGTNSGLHYNDAVVERKNRICQRIVTFMLGYQKCK